MLNLENGCEHFGEVNVFGLVPITCSDYTISNIEKLIKEKNIKSWLVLDPECLLLADIDKISKMVKVHLAPIIDFSVPTFKEMDEIIVFIKEYKSKGNILISCLGGHGRTGTILSIWAGINGIDDPVKYIRDIYCGCAVETLGQEMFVNEYVKQVRVIRVSA